MYMKQRQSGGLTLVAGLSPLANATHEETSTADELDPADADARGSAAWAGRLTSGAPSVSRRSPVGAPEDVVFGKNSGIG
ncbi:hypothetical protein MRX96_058217 [Rhipicephalus microplus]